MVTKPLSSAHRTATPGSAGLPGGVWRASEQALHRGRPVVQAHHALDAWLPDGGWPLGSLTELLVDAPGCGEIALVVPALKRLPAQSPIALLNPPAVPNASAWQLSAQRLWWLHPQRLSDAWWSAETILRSQTFGALLAWLDPIQTAPLRRLQACAQASNTLVFLFRPSNVAYLFSPCPLRLGLSPGAQGALQVSVLKSKGRKPSEPLTLWIDSSTPNSSVGIAYVDGHDDLALA